MHRFLLFFGVAALASATSFSSVNFTFDTQTINGNTITGLGSGAGSSSIQSYMNQVLSAAGCSGCSVTVLSVGNTIGAVADRTYNGDGNVTGPGTGSKSLTLGTSDGATASNTNSTVNSSYDTFIANTNDSSGTVSQQITLQFKGFTGLGLTINSFDFEVFPDGTCTALTSTKCGGAANGSGIYPHQPDLIFQAGNNTNGSDPVVTTFYGVTPNTTNGTANKAPCSSTGTCDGASSGDSTVNSPQYIGTWSGNLTNVTELNFVDWPATIGLDNLTVTWNTQGPAVPEPVSVLLLGTAVAGLVLRKKLRKA